MKKIFTLIVISLITACNSTPKREVAAPPPPPMSEKTKIEASTQVQITEIKGVDISKYQGTVDFSKLKAAGVHYVFIRATEGITYQDADYKTNHAGAKAAGLRVGVYHFYETDDDPQAQLNNFKSLVSLSTGDLAPVIDIEKLHQKDDKDLIVNLIQFLDGLESHYKIKPIVYTGKKFANKYLSGFGDYPLWLAEYQVDQPMIPNGWKSWTFWQWSESGTMNGIEGLVDMDRFNGNQNEFNKLLIK
jgi:lysozyme